MEVLYKNFVHKYGYFVSYQIIKGKYIQTFKQYYSMF